MWVAIVLSGMLILVSANEAVAGHSEVVDKLSTGNTTRVSVSSSGEEGDGDSGWGRLGSIAGLPCKLGVSASDNGRYVAFASLAGNLHPADVNGRVIIDIFVYDRKKEKLDLVSATPAGVASATPVDSDGGLCSVVRSHTPRISGNGRYVAFVSNLPMTGTQDPEATNLRDNVYIRDLKAGTTELVSHTFNDLPPTGGVVGSGNAGLSISDDGRLVAFASDANNILEGVCDVQAVTACEQVYVRDLNEGQTHLVSVSNEGQPGNAGSRAPAISGNGQAVAFDSEATNLTSGDLNLFNDVYLRDLRADRTELISVSRSGSPGNDVSVIGGSGGSALSDDARFVTFSSKATDMVPAYPPTNLRPTSYCDVYSFLRDRETGRVDRVSVSSTGTILHAMDQDISDDGRFVRFRGRTVNNFAAGADPCAARIETDRSHDVSGELIQDRRSGQVDWVGYRAGGTTDTPPPGSEFDVLGLGGNGLFVFGFALAEDDQVVENDNNDAVDVVVRDFHARGLGSGWVQGGRRIQMPRDSMIGHRGALLADDPSDADVPGVGAEILEASVVYRETLDDLFVRIDLDRLAGFDLSTLIPIPVVYGVRIDVGTRVYELRAQALGGPPLQGGARIGLFECTETCIEVRRVNGGYGTVGENVVASLPLSDLGLEQGGRIQKVEAFAALGSYEFGATRMLDRTEP